MPSRYSKKYIKKSSKKQLHKKRNRKSKSKKHIRNRKTKSKKHIRNRKTKSNRKHYGGNNEQVKCSICENTTHINNTLVPSKCYKLNLDKAHRICQDCWWNNFSKEKTDHTCPGCNKQLPLTTSSYNSNDVIDLT
jgi:hypothetical protein